MLDKIKFQNHLGETFLTGQDYLFANESDLRNYEWDANFMNNRIASFSQSIKDKIVPLVIAMPQDKTAYQMANKIIDVTEKDIADGKPGRFIIGDYFMRAYINGVYMEGYTLDKRYMQYNLLVKAEDAAWYKAKTYHFTPSGSEEGLNYPHDFEHNFSRSANTQVMKNESAWPAFFEITVYGPCANPAVYINDHKYQVNVTLIEGEYLKISCLGAKDKKIIKYGIGGLQESVYASQDSQSYIFELIPSGTSRATWSGSFGWDIEIYEKRSAPKWI